MTSVWVFPGQGSQRTGMGKDVFDRYPERVAEADAVLGYSLRRLCLEDPDGVLHLTQFTQPALFAVSALSFLAKRDDGARLPEAYAGHSLGEFNALFAAGAFDFATGIALVAKRGELMSKAPPGGMAAVIGLDLAAVRAVLAGADLAEIDIANINSPNQIVISGLRESIQRCEPLFLAAGARYVRLNVSAAFHSRHMREVEAQFAAFLSDKTLHSLQVDVISNRTARPHARDGYLPHLIEQISHPVNWYESMSWLLSRGETTMEEVGPGNVLSGLFASIRKNPMPIPEAVERNLAASSPKLTGKRRIVFMYPGQGSQYYGMGRELYASDTAFRGAMDDCNGIYREITGRDMIAEIYDEMSRWREMTDIALSHPALYSIGYSLTATLLGAGIRPDAVLGYGLGEYSAAVAANSIPHDAALPLVIRQAELMKSSAMEGGMLSVIAPTAHVRQHADVYRETTISSVNFDGNFAISGSEQALDEVARNLGTMSIASSRLPVGHPIHSRLMMPLEASFRALNNSVAISSATIPQYSSTGIGQLATPDVDHYWRVVCDPVDFPSAVAAGLEDGDCRWVDLSPNGTLSCFIKHGFGKRMEHIAVMNRFGRNVESLAEAVGLLTA